MNFLTNIRLWLLKKLHGVDVLHAFSLITEAGTKQFELGQLAGVAEGERRAKIKFAVLPLPFTDDQLRGRDYGEFITPAGFGVSFGECNIPAPGPHGYEQRAYYVQRDRLVLSPNAYDLMCHHVRKFEDPANSRELVPVIVTVLR